MYDFEHFRAVLEGRAVDWVPPAELGVDLEVREAFLGRKIAAPADEVDFWRQAGYCYAGLRLWSGYVEPFNLGRPEMVTHHRHAYGLYGEQEEREWATESKGCITSWEEFERFPWPSADGGRYEYLAEAAAQLPAGMKLIVVEGRVFQTTWMLMGFAGLSYALAETPELVRAVMDKVAEVRLAGFARSLSMEGVGAAWLPDDIAYTEGLMVSPKFYRENLFPWYRRFVEVGRQLNKPVIYHTDGRLWEVLEDLIACGFTALHPIEPKAMEGAKVKRLADGRLCLIGNVEVDRLARGTPEEVRRLVKARIEALGFGSYCVGSSNSVTNYVPLENYRALLAASREYGRK